MLCALKSVSWGHAVRCVFQAARRVAGIPTAEGPGRGGVRAPMWPPRRPPPLAPVPVPMLVSPRSPATLCADPNVILYSFTYCITLSFRLVALWFLLCMSFDVLPRCTSRHFTSQQEHPEFEGFFGQLERPCSSKLPSLVFFFWFCSILLIINFATGLFS